jgi:endo-1,3-1,4-beta-glycanase ExoK
MIRPRCSERALRGLARSSPCRFFFDPCGLHWTLHIEVKLRPSSVRHEGGALSAGRLAFAISTCAVLFGCGSQQDLVLGTVDFSLVHRDDFDGVELNSDYWEVATHSFSPNLAWFSLDNAKIENGRLVLSITDVPAPATPMANESQKPYSAAEVRTRVPFLYGRFRTRARFASGTGIVSAFWGFYDHYSMSSGSSLENQIVIENGVPNTSTAYDLRYAVNVPFEKPEPKALPPGFDPSADFHELGFDWTPESVTFFLDGVSQLAITGQQATQLREYERLVLSAYPSGADWISDFDPKQLPVTAEFDWVEISEYQGPRP